MTNRTNAPPTVAIIGAGRLGTALGLSLATHGYTITSLVAQHRKSAQRAVRAIKRFTSNSAHTVAPRALAADELERLPPAAIYLFTTPDDRLRHASTELARVSCAGGGEKRKPPSVALHTSGALASDELAALREAGCALGSLHPLAAVTADAREGARALSEAFYCIEGDAAAVRAARRIVRSLGGRSFTIEPDKKPLYHAAAVITAGHTVALFDIACEMLTRCGLDERTARETLLPLLDSTARNLRRQPPAQALTGTFARGDAATLQLHLAALRAERLQLAEDVYRLLGRRALLLAESNGADKRTLNHIRKLLDAK
jgi:predicted short-subunit dehydrogenase-like oxidoreductase (DUF2520 family)